MVPALAQPLAARDEVVLVAAAKGIPAPEWDRLARRGFHLHRWCTAAETCGWQPHHLAVREGTGYKAILPTYLTHDGTLHDVHSRWFGPLSGLAAATRFAIRPVLSVQSPLGQTSDALGDLSGVSDTTLHEIFATLELTAEQEGAKAVIWPFVDAAHTRLLQVGRERGYAMLYAGATARIEILWGSFTEYVGSRSKSVRRTIRADLAASQAADLRTTFAADFRGAAAALDRQYRESYRRRNRREPALAPHFFAALASNPAQDIQALLTWHHERLVGGSLNLIKPELMDGTMAAFSPGYVAGPAYYNDLCYDPIRLAIRDGLAAVDVGPTALYAKVLRGAVLRRRMVLIKGTNRARHKLLEALGHVVARRIEYKERRSLGALSGRA